MSYTLLGAARSAARTRAARPRSEALDLDIGGYGSDHSDRYRLVQVARQRAAAKYGLPFGRPDAAVVIGDTPRDIEAAHLGGAGLLAVASGAHPCQSRLPYPRAAVTTRDQDAEW